MTEALVGLAFGVACTLAHMRLMRGGLRHTLIHYFDPEVPRWVRQVPFVLLPGALLALFGCALILFSEYFVRDPADWAIYPIAFVSLGLVVWMCLRWFRPLPDRAKPEWIKQIEQERRISDGSYGSRDR